MCRQNVAVLSLPSSLRLSNLIVGRRPLPISGRRNLSGISRFTVSVRPPSVPSVPYASNSNNPRTANVRPAASRRVSALLSLSMTEQWRLRTPLIHHCKRRRHQHLVTVSGTLTVQQPAWPLRSECRPVRRLLSTDADGQRNHRSSS